MTWLSPTITGNIPLIALFGWVFWIAGISTDIDTIQRDTWAISDTIKNVVEVQVSHSLAIQSNTQNIVSTQEDMEEKFDDINEKLEAILANR